MPPPHVPPAATAAFGAATGPRVVPGQYTVRMKKDNNVLTTPLIVEMDPRVTWTLDDRRAQFALVNKIAGTLNTMTETVARMNKARAALEAKHDRTALDQLDEMRKKIVATKEGGMITGEQRLREYVAELYGTVNDYEGRPTQMQADRADSLAHELNDVIAEFDTWMKKHPELAK